jgi:hypothetical protein
VLVDLAVAFALRVFEALQKLEARQRTSGAPRERLSGVAVLQPAKSRALMFARTEADRPQAPRRLHVGLTSPTVVAS